MLKSTMEAKIPAKIIFAQHFLYLLNYIKKLKALLQIAN